MDMIMKMLEEEHRKHNETTWAPTFALLVLRPIIFVLRITIGVSLAIYVARELGVQI